MFRSLTRFSFIAVILACCAGSMAQPLNIPFTSGPIPQCDTSVFTANVSGIGTLEPPGSFSGWGYYSFQSLTINITTDHPQTLQIFITSPSGTTLLLSEFNGAGGQDYVNCTFDYFSNTSITTGAAPFTGLWEPQGGDLDVFDYENADGTWTITVIDTACANGGTGPNGTWGPGYFDGSGGGNGGFFMTFYNPPPPCWGGIIDDQATICAGQTFDIPAYYTSLGYGYSFFIYDINFNYIPNQSSVDVADDYMVEAYDPFDGCTYYAIFTLNVTSSALGPDVTVDQCTSAGPVDLTSYFSLTGLTPDWSLNGSPITPATVTAASASGTYQLVVSGGGCNDTALVTLNMITSPTLGPDQTADICTGTSLDLTTLYPTAGFTADWYFGGTPYTSPTVASSPGVYMLVASDPGGCADTAEVTLTVQPLALGPDQTLDLCDNQQLDLTALYTTTGLSTTWSSAGSVVPSPTAINSGGMYQLNASNGTGCADSALVIVNLVSSPALGTDATDSICAGNGVDLTSFYTTAGLSSSWTNSGAVVSTPSSVNTTGTYILVATNLVGCSDTASVNVIVSPNPVLGADTTLTECDGQIVDLTSLYNVGTNTTQWTVSGTPVVDPSSVSTSGTYILDASNSVGCTSTVSVILAVDPSPDLGADQLASICAGSSFDLIPTFNTTGLTATWTQNGTLVFDPTNVNGAGVYQLLVSNNYGCSDTAVVDLSVEPGPALGVDLNFSLCEWQTVDLGAVYPVVGLTTTYTIEGAPVPDPTSVYDTGNYLVSVTDANGCTDQAMAAVTNIECECEADLVHNTHCMQEPVQFTLLADSAVLGAHWDLGSAGTSEEWDPVVMFSEEGEVMVTLEVTLSCGVVTIERPIHVPDCSDSCTVWIPNTFTPNNDGINDGWMPVSDCHPDDLTIQVFDRFGEVVYAANDLNDPWDGAYAGARSPIGVYVYKVGYQLPYQERKEVTGVVNLVR